MSARAFRLMVVYKVHELSNQLSTRDPKLMQSMEIWSTGQSAKAAYPASHVTITGSVDSVLMMTDSVPRMRQARQLEKYKRLLPYVTDRMLIIYMSVIMALGGILTLVINITDKQFAMRPVNIYCFFMWGFFPVTGIIILYFFVVFPVILWRVWRDNDAYGIRNDLIICDTVGVVCMAVTMVWVNVLHETQQIWPGLSFIWFFAVLIHITSVLIPLLRSMQHIKVSQSQEILPFSIDLLPSDAHATVNISQGRRFGFNRMLDDPVEYQKFRMFAVSCFCSELTGFVEEYQALKARTVAVLQDQNQNQTEGSGLSQIIPPSPDTDAHMESIDAQYNNMVDSINRRHKAQSMAASSLALDYAASTRGGGCITGINVGILETVKKECPVEINPYKDKSGVLQFPPALIEKIDNIFAVFVDPISYASVNATQPVVRRVTEGINSHEYPLTLLDELKDEVLFMLYTDVFTRYIRK
ncbi:hypothetical protein LPJ66_003876 [Kickxella alabastrina]|uniref:Uncharacterized protein n=1 Tax=Kickxella alabastrina TaxID=61397 RepID=A0ACC1IJI0_9FUNG|nr:hypothetical protein LPJ66_003876 [Kickxella alabastrina]